MIWTWVPRRCGAPCNCEICLNSRQELIHMFSRWTIFFRKPWTHSELQQSKVIISKAVKLPILKISFVRDTYWVRVMGLKLEKFVVATSGTIFLLTSAIMSNFSKMCSTKKLLIIHLQFLRLLFKIDISLFKCNWSEVCPWTWASLTFRSCSKRPWSNAHLSSPAPLLPFLILRPRRAALPVN